MSHDFVPPSNLSVIFDPNESAENLLSEFEINFSDLKFSQIIGNGAFGEVSDGIYIPTNQRVAIKKLHIVPNDKRSKELFYREVECLAKVSHRFLLPFIGFTPTSPFCIVTKFIPNGTLYNALHREDENLRLQLSGTDLTAIAYGIADGMRYLHEKEILHRDLKSQNIMLDEEMMPIICDFGSSRRAEQEKTMSTTSAGTSNYMAPEFIAGGHYNKEVDVYSFGMILWEMLSKKIPFSNLEPAQVIYTVVILKNRPFLGSDVPTPLKNLIERCWAHEPDERPTFQEIYELFLSGSVEFQGNIRDKFLKKIGYLAKIPNSSSLGKRKRSFNYYSLQRINHPIASKMLISHQSSLSFSSLEFDLSYSKDKAQSLLSNLSINSPNLPYSLDFFESNIDDPSFALIDIWEPFLKLLNQAPQYAIPDIQNIALKLAQRQDVRHKIHSVKFLYQYLDSNTIDIFLYFISFEFECVTIQIVDKLIELSLNSGKVSEKAIKLLYKIATNFHSDSNNQYFYPNDFSDKIQSFFLSAVSDFYDKNGGYIIFKCVSMLKKITSEVITSYSKSKIKLNVLAAYEAIFTISWVSGDLFQLSDVLDHIKSDDEDLREAGFEFLRRFSKDVNGCKVEQIIDALLFSGMKYGSEESVILLCRIAKDYKPCQMIISEAKKWLASNYPNIFIQLYLVLFNFDQTFTNQLFELDENYAFLSNFLNNGQSGVEIVVASILNKLTLFSNTHIDKTSNSAQFIISSKLVKFGICSFLCKCIPTYQDYETIIFIGNAISKVAQHVYCSELLFVTRHLVLKAINNDPHSKEYLHLMSCFCKYKEILQVFHEENAQNLLFEIEHFNTQNTL